MSNKKNKNLPSEIDEEDISAILMLSSIPLRELNSDNYPIGFGCIAGYKGQKFILTVSHVNKNQRNWSIEVKTRYGKRTELYQIGPMIFLKKLNILTEEFKDIEFSFVKLTENVSPYYQEFDDQGNETLSIPRTVLDLNIDNKLIENNKFGFAGKTRFKSYENFLYGEPRIVKNMTFVKQKEDLFIFKLPSKHPGHEYFKATSGAPIIDNFGNVVALVTSGDLENDLIYGVSLNKYKSILGIDSLV